MTAPTLVFGWGNPSRGDDALGPRFIEAFATLAARHPEWGAIDVLTDFQLQVEHALDLAGRRRVLFVDACAVSANEPVTLTRVTSHPDASLSSHALSPQALLAVAADLDEEASPACWLLAIAGSDFTLGAPLSAAAEDNLRAALARAAQWVVSAEID